MKGLILVESPTKARTLFRFLKGTYDIEASMGHVRDLPKGDLGVDVEHNFEPKYVIPSDKRKVVESLKEKVKHASTIILATDPDREGEAIAHHLYELLKPETLRLRSGQASGHGARFDRIVFHEITQGAITHALSSPRTIDQNLVSAQTARRVLDRIVGYKLSPLLWEKVQRKLSAGRVQSVAVRLIVEREREIGHFIKEEFYRVFVLLAKGEGNQQLEFELIHIDGEKVEAEHTMQLYDGNYTYKKTMLSKKSTDRIVEEFKTIKTFEVIDVSKKETKRSPYPPFITSSLQQDGARRLGFPPKKTMMVAQRLYEEGYITYHRTDSYNVSSQFVNQARGYIEKEFGKKYLSDSPRIYKTKSKVAQEAHEAIRPTSLDENSIPQEAGRSSKLGRDYERLYDLIWKRAVATQMADAIFDSTKIQAEGKSSRVYLLECSGSVLKFDGFLRLGFGKDDDVLLPDVSVGEKLKLLETNITDHTTTPPPRYNEASLIASLEKNGIGRPSTYAPIISTIQDRYYVEKTEGRFIPTLIGIVVNDFLVQHFPAVDDIPFTAEMEEGLDTIARGERPWQPMIKTFYEPFEKTLVTAQNSQKVDVPVEKTGKMCPTCGKELIIRRSRFGKFYACSGFPECRYTESIVYETNAVCPEDGGKIIIRKTRRGRTFYGCSNYPKCKFAVWKLEDIKNKQGLDSKDPQVSKTKNKN